MLEYFIQIPFFQASSNIPGNLIQYLVLFRELRWSGIVIPLQWAKKSEPAMKKGS
jgi:hypothetical protein